MNAFFITFDLVVGFEGQKKHTADVLELHCRCRYRWALFCSMNFWRINQQNLTSNIELSSSIMVFLAWGDFMIRESLIGRINELMCVCACVCVCFIWFKSYMIVESLALITASDTNDVYYDSIVIGLLDMLIWRVSIYYSPLIFNHSCVWVWHQCHMTKDKNQLRCRFLNAIDDGWCKPTKHATGTGVVVNQPSACEQIPMWHIYIYISINSSIRAYSHGFIVYSIYTYGYWIDDWQCWKKKKHTECLILLSPQFFIVHAVTNKAKIARNIFVNNAWLFCAVPIDGFSGVYGNLVSSCDTNIHAHGPIWTCDAQ